MLTDLMVRFQEAIQAFWDARERQQQKQIEAGRVDPIFAGASYARRYEVLSERLVLERKYTSACLTLATKDDPTAVTFPAAALNFRQFAAAIDAHARAFINTR